MADHQKNSDSDQSKFNLGVRDVESDDTEMGRFDEIEEEEYLSRRDPEENKHNEAGRHVVTQGDLEFDKLGKNGRADPNNYNPEGGKISDSKPQESL